MQTPAEKYLIHKCIHIIRELKSPKIINLGAGTSLVIEKSIQKEIQQSLIFDRMDVADCSSKHKLVGKCYLCSVDNMSQIKNTEYDLALANYVLEHVADLPQAALEIARILKPKAYFITSLPNPQAPEFKLSKHTPTGFHQLIKGKGKGHEAHETHYAYTNITEFIHIFKKDFELVEVKYWANTYGYLYRFPIINIFSYLYDKLINLIGIKWLMGNVCLVFQKK